MFLGTMRRDLNQWCHGGGENNMSTDDLIYAALQDASRLTTRLANDVARLNATWPKLPVPLHGDELRVEIAACHELLSAIERKLFVTKSPVSNTLEARVEQVYEHLHHALDIGLSAQQQEYLLWECVRMLNAVDAAIAGLQ